MSSRFSSYGSRQFGTRWLLGAILAGLLLTILVGVLVGVLKRCDDCPPVDCPTSTTTTPPEGTTSEGASTTPDPAKPWLTMRLPAYLQPSEYRVRLFPEFGDDAKSFSGEVDIHLKVTEPTSVLLVHVKYLSVTNTVVKAEDGAIVEIDSTFNYTENQFWVIQLKQQLAANSSIVVQLQYEGHYFGIVGLYQSGYEEDGKKLFLATTKFQPTDARKAFPCLDEPQLKARFNIELVYPNDSYKALANTLETSTEEFEGNRKLTKFEPTPKMSTYLFCILISKFGSRSQNTTGNSQFTVWAPASRIDQANYSLESGVKIQDYFGVYFNYSYEKQMKKQDMAAIPDFPSGAMEHWGLVTYRDTAMLFDSASGSAVNKQRVVTVVAHELAHMWFGNLVTMLWWNDLWLNEGFASFFADRGAAVVENTWELEDQGIVNTYNSAFNADDTIASHPIIVDVATPQEITQIFDTITYSKGKAVIIQLEDYLGKDAFQKGLQDFLSANEFGVASTPALYKSLQKFTSEDVTEFMDRWTRQMGFPLVTVATTNDPNRFTVRQNWFLRDPSTRDQAPGSPYNYEWHIKLSYLTGNNQSQVMLRTESETFQVDGDLSSRPLKFNAGQRGFYRVNYPDEWWLRMAAALKANATVYPAIDRAGLLGDAFTVARGNQLNYSSVTPLLAYLRNEDHYLPWSIANSGLGFITQQLQRRPTYGQWQSFVRNLTSNIYDKIGFTEQTAHLDKLLQPIVLGLACSAANSKCRTEATKIFNQWKDQNISVNAEQRSIVYKYGLIEQDTAETWEFLWQKYTMSDTATEKERLLYALAQTRIPWLISRLLENARDRNLVRSQDFVTLIGYIGSNPAALEQLWTWTRANWNQLLDEFGREDRRLGAMIPNFAVNFNDKFHLEEYERFINSTEAGAGENARRSTLARIRANVAWILENEAEIVRSLHNA